MDEPISTRDMAFDTIGLMEALGISGAHIVGRSMGVQSPSILRSSGPIWSDR